MYADRFAPARAWDELEIHTADGVALRAVLRDPAGAPRASIVLVHGLFERKSAFDAVAAALVQDGFQTLAFDFRDGDFDAMARSDLPAVVDGVRARADGRAVIVVAHSLGARVAVAAQATGLIRADALVLLGGSTWWRAAAATPFARRFRMLAGAAFAPGRTEVRGPLVRAPRRLDAHHVCGFVERALAQARP